MPIPQGLDVRTAGAHRFAYLDGIRGAAVLAVLATHWLGAFLPHQIRGGFIGVDVFFVLSGYLITSILIDRRTPWRTFMVRRAWRLLPALFFMLASVTVLVGLLGRSTIAHRTLNRAMGAAVQLTGVVAGPRIMGGFQPFLHTWSLSVEWYFYLAWPLVVALLVRLPFAATARGLAVVAGVTWVVMLGVTPRMFYFTPPIHMGSLCLGASVAFWMRSGRPVPRFRLFFLLTISLIIWVVGSSALTSPNFKYFFPFVSLWAAFAILIGPEGHLSLLNWAPLTAVGRASYSIYLWHVLAVTVPALIGFKGKRMLVLAMVITVAMSVFSYYFLEKPFLKARKKKPRSPMTESAKIESALLVDRTSSVHETDPGDLPVLDSTPPAVSQGRSPRG